MRSIDFHPSSTPRFRRAIFRAYADEWVFVRAGRVVQHAAKRDELIGMCAARRLKNGDRFLHLPPVSTSRDG